MMCLAFHDYTKLLLGSRKKFAAESIFGAICASSIKPDILELFWIHYCSIGVGMTEPVEGWIRRAGEQCVEMGWEQLGQTLIADSTQEAGHHLLMIADTKTLVNRWNQGHSLQLDAQQLLSQTYPRSVADYVKLHEDVIAGPEPFGQIAIEFEIERLAVQYGTQLIAVSQKALGEDFKSALSFIQTHVTLDVEHSKESEIKLNRFLEQYPEHTNSLALVGATALDIYGQFLDDCLQAAQSYDQLLTYEKSLISSC